MLLRLMLLLTVIPLVELLVLVKLTPLWGGFGVTVAVIIGTGVLGAALARHEGLRVLRAVQRKLTAGELPADELLDGLLILVAGALLVTPGLLTDLTGFLLLVPPARAVVRGLAKRWAQGKIRTGGFAAGPGMGFRPMHEEPPAGFPPLEDEDDGHH